MNPTQDGKTSSAVLEPDQAQAADLRTILLLDPVTLFLRLEETILARRDWRIHAVRTAEEALQVLETEHVDLVVMDHVLPDTTGDDLIRGIRANPRTRATGVLVLTARGAQGAVERCLAAGANGAIFKPVTRQELCSRVEDLLYVAARRHVRTLVRLEVETTTGVGAIFGQTINISAGGLLLETATPLAMGEVLQLRFALPGEDEPLIARARVVRESQVSENGSHACGLSFEGMNEGDRGRIEAFVATRVNPSGAVAPAAG